MPEFAQLVIYYRNRARLSQSALARRCGVDHSYISRLEAGNRDPGLNIVVAIADVCQLDPPERDQLRVAAGFAPADPLWALHAEAALLDVARVIVDPDTPAPIADALRAALAAARTLAALADAA